MFFSSYYYIHIVVLLLLVVGATGFASNLRQLRPTSNTYRGKSGQHDSINGVLELEQSNLDKKIAVIVCPAQFCVPVDYEDLLETIQTEVPNVIATRVVPLPRTEWIKVAKQLPTKDFIDANLSVKVTLDWYFNAIESALAELFAEGGEDTEICLIGHSIGGWIARAYLGGLSGTATSVNRLSRTQVKTLITIGTPHSSPENALVDQTRGLLREIATSEDCSSQALSDRGVKITCVGSSSVPGKLITTDVEELIAATSYLPLVGKLGDDVKGDGIVPTEIAFMESPARRVEIEKCSLSKKAVRHAHVLPTPWNLIDGSAASIKLPEDIVWYGSPGVLNQWIKYIQ